MGLFDNAVPGGNITKPLMIALGALLVGKMLSGRSAEPDQPETAAPPTPAPTGANLATAACSADWAACSTSSRTPATAMSPISWVGTGQNQSINANDLGNAIGPQVIREIAQRTGLDEQELLKQLSAALPGIVDKLTPNGQVPQQHQVASAFNS